MLSQGKVLGSTWLTERQECNGSQTLRRNPAYFEYPSVLAMMLHRVRYGLELGFRTVNVILCFVRDNSCCCEI
jgi:hypothetical protein